MEKWIYIIYAVLTLAAAAWYASTGTIGGAVWSGGCFLLWAGLAGIEYLTEKLKEML